jgi:xylulokinase
MVVTEQETAGATLSFMRDKIFFNDDELNMGMPEMVYRKFDALAESVPAGSGKLIFTPWLYGERTPVENDTVRGVCLNLSLDTTRSHMVRAMYEGVAYNTRWLMGCVEKFIKRPFPYLNFIGGGANSNIWCQIFADVLNRKIRQVDDPITANARGAAFLASLSLGYITLDQISEKIKIKKEYVPNPENREIYDELFNEFLNVYDNTKSIFKRLNSQE